MSPSPSFARALALVAFLLAATGCDDDTVVTPNDDIAFLVGEWEARSFVVSNPANPIQSVDVVQDLDGSFELFVEPSGRYTALLVVDFPQPPESGILFLDDGLLILDPDAGEPSPTEFELVGERVILRGDTEFDFNFDGESDPAELVIDLVPAG